ncbi:MAG: hypothetical protein G8345_19690 [Magnetococcales bacterium]|nr:hypothetical protein [Magnetococcales bacterium]NGZ29097.1 hypothetical protein [Magnetococcales bacterium]
MISSKAAQGSSQTQQKSRSESGRTSDGLQQEIVQAKQQVAQDAKEKSKQSYVIRIGKAEQVATKPAMPGLSQPLREYMRMQNS